MKNKIRIVLLTAVVAVLFLAGCAGPDGNVYTAFDWVSKPSYLSIEDPAVPLTVYPSVYYMTSPGSHYMEYGHPSYYPPYVRYITYTVVSYPGNPGMRQGDDAFFTVWLFETMSPVLVEDSARSLAAGGSMAAPAAASAALVNQSAPASGAGDRVKQYAYTETKGGYEISVEGGIVRAR